MNGIDRISERILKDARAEAARIIEEAQERARSLKEDRVGQVEKENEKYNRESILRAEEHKRRMLAMAGLEMRKEVLAAKQELIDHVMEKAGEAIMEMPREEYRHIVTQMLLEAAQGHEEVYFSVADEARLDQSIVDEVNELLRARGRKGELKLSPRREEFHGGFILRTGGMEINNTFGALIRMSRDEVESQLAKILFKEEG
ncbi:MAG: hypothetical protein GX340_04280 [Clostridiales bacterium]|jgi:V/A-type H+-transporting ATPase subunit E|nr:hypothetical protein [Clostridiales bacterium]